MRSRLFIAALALASSACTGFVISWAQAALSSSEGAFASDNDPDLVKDAAPFALKAMESLLPRSPENTDLLLALAAGFTQYAFAFVQSAADEAEARDIKQAQQLRARAAKLYARAHAYGQKGLEIRHPGFAALLTTDRAKALAQLNPNDVALVYWTGLAWAAQISVSKNDLSLVAQLPDAAQMMATGLALDESYEHGAAHAFFIIYDGGRSEALGGSEARARKHFDRAVALSHGERLAPYVSWAENICVQHQDLVGFTTLLEKVMAFDVDSAPSFRLENTLSQKRAQRLLAQTADLFVEAQ